MGEHSTGEIVLLSPKLFGYRSTSHIRMLEECSWRLSESDTTKILI